MFVCNFNITISVSGNLETSTNVQYLRTLGRVKNVSKFDWLSADVESSNPLAVEDIILGLGVYFFPGNSLLKKKSAIRHGMRKHCGLKVRRYRDNFIDLN